VHEFDDVMTVARKGLVISLPGHQWRPVRKAVLPRVQPRMCGIAAWVAIYDGIRLCGFEASDLGAWGRLGLIRLAVRMFLMGPRIDCPHCRALRKAHR